MKFPWIRMLAIFVALVSAGCIRRELRPLNPCITSGVAKSLSVTAVDKVDLLLVVDNSFSMAPHQAALQEQFPRIIQGLVTGNPDGVGDAEFPPVASLRVAVVSTDMGVGGVGTGTLMPDVMSGITSCGRRADLSVDSARAYYGDNGIFNRVPIGAPTVGDQTDCDGDDGDATPDVLTSGTLPDFLTFDPAGALTEGDFANRIGCYAVLGIDGCGFEQQLEAMLKSLAPASSGIVFPAEGGSIESTGQGDRENAGWLREDALLAVLMVTDEDDCSASDGRVFNYALDNDVNEHRPYGETSGGPGAQANTRCVRFGDEIVDGNPNGNQPSLLHPVSRYAEGLIAIKGDPTKIVFGMITGVPLRSVDGTYGDGVSNLDALLDPAVTPAMTNRLLTRTDTNPDTAFAVRQNSCFRCPYGFPPEMCSGGTNNLVGDAIGGYGVGGFNDLDGDGVNAPDCVDLDVGPGNHRPGLCDLDANEVLNCVVEMNGTPGCQIDETEVQVDIDAVPPRRLVRAAREMRDAGISVIVQSICADSFTSAITGILTKIALALNGSCLPNALNRTSSNEVECQVVEVLPVGRTCAEFASQGRSLRAVEGTREACLVTQVAVPPEVRATELEPPASLGAGWYYDDFTDDARACGSEAREQRISFTAGAAPIQSSTLRLECSQSVPGDLDGPDVGDACGSSPTACDMTQEQLDVFVVRYNLAGTYSPANSPLVCQSESNTCQVGCGSDADCPGGYVCFDSVEGNEGTPYCADPTCR